MKNVTGLNEPIRDYRGEVIRISPDNPAMFCVRDALANAAAGMRQPTVKSGWIANQVATKLWTGGDEVALEDAEFEVLRAAVGHADNKCAPFVLAACITAMGGEVW